MLPPALRMGLLGALLAGGPLLAAAQPAPTPSPAAGGETRSLREQFYRRAEAAFATRDPKSVAALADAESWRAAGYPELSSLQMFLPPGPVVLEKENAPGEAIYRDGGDRRWRLVLRDVKGDYRAVVRADPCPQGIVRGPAIGPDEKPRSPVQTWTILECWPLPR